MQRSWLGHVEKQATSYRWKENRRQGRELLRMQEQAPCMPPRKQVSTAMFYHLRSSQQPMQISAEADSVGGGGRTQHGADGQDTTVRQGAGQTSCRLAQNMFGWQGAEPNPLHCRVPGCIANIQLCLFIHISISVVFKNGRMYLYRLQNPLLWSTATLSDSALNP